MRIGASLFLIAIGAILKFAVTTSVKGIDLGIVGVVLMIIGAVGLLAELFFWGSRRRTHIVATAPPAVDAYGRPVEPGTARY